MAKITQVGDEDDYECFAKQVDQLVRAVNHLTQSVHHS